MTFPIVHRERVRFRDCDSLGHVNNAVYLTYLEEAVNEWLGPVLGLDWVTVRVEIDFRRELRGLGGEVAVRMRVERVGTSSITGVAEVAGPDGEVAADARVVVVAWDPETRRPRPLDERQRAELSRL
jgi:acyl-CoA thioester hydrolase